MAACCTLALAEAALARGGHEIERARVASLFETVEDRLTTLGGQGAVSAVGSASASGVGSVPAPSPGVNSSAREFTQ